MRFFLICFFALTTYHISIAQKKAQAKASSQSSTSASSSSSTSTANQPVAGYSYYLPKKFHLQYHSLKIVMDTSWEEAKAQVDSACFCQEFKTFIHRDSIFIDTITSGSAPGDFVFSEEQPAPAVTIRIKKDSDYTKLISDTCICNPLKICGACKDFVHLPKIITTNIFIDSTDRYYDDASRLRVTISPSDSGRLSVTFDEVDFKNSAERPWNDDVKRFLPEGEITTAHPIFNTDSANNFYIQVNVKNYASDPASFYKFRYSLWQGGVLTVPFRLRFSNKENIGGYTDPSHPFESGITAQSESTASFNLAAYYSYATGGTKFYADQGKTHNGLAWTFAGFLGPTVIALSANNVKSGTDLNKYPANIFVLSGGGAVSVQSGSFSIGLFLGRDLPVTSNNVWVYSQRTWIGLGFGFNLNMFSPGGNSVSQSK